MSSEEYKRVLFVRKSGAYPPPGADYVVWVRLICRLHALFPNTVEREMWHEAGHIVVGHHLGCSVQRIRRDHEGVPSAAIMRPAGWQGIDEATVAVAGWLAEAVAFSPEFTDPTEEVSDIAKGVRTRTGEKMAPSGRVRFIEHVEHRAMDILNAHWDAVERVAALAMIGLPVERGSLLAAIDGNDP